MDPEKKEIIKNRIMDWLFREQIVYDNYWVKNAWGFGKNMRDYLLEGHRLMKMDLGRTATDGVVQ